MRGAADLVCRTAKAVEECCSPLNGPIGARGRQAGPRWNAGTTAAGPGDQNLKRVWTRAPQTLAVSPVGESTLVPVTF